ncbi:hypothetical protein QL285_060541 [Trifolium repens]|nr:hypothetical protein QL285_060541 [Trifolium repens]
MNSKWADNVLLDCEGIGIICYELFLLSHAQESVNSGLKYLKKRCGFCGANHHNDFCEQVYLKEEEREVINIDYNSQLNNILDEFLRSNQLAFDEFGVECSNLVEKANLCEKMVESKMEHCAIMVEEEDLKNKINGIRRVNHDDLYVTFDSQPMKLEEKDHLPKKNQPSSRLESAHSMSLFVGAWGHLILYVKFMEVLPNKRKKKDDAFFLSFRPP